MSAFNQDQFTPFTLANVARVAIYDQITLIDAAYQVDDRETCAKMIEDLYALFDRHLEASNG